MKYLNTVLFLSSHNFEREVLSLFPVIFKDFLLAMHCKKNPGLSSGV
jgi:hypothetical protein